LEFLGNRIYTLLTGVWETSNVNSIVLPGSSFLDEDSTSVENAEELMLTESHAMEEGPEFRIVMTVFSGCGAGATKHEDLVTTNFKILRDSFQCGPLNKIKQKGTRSF